MSALTKIEKKDINEQHDLSIIEQVVMQGDLAKLNPEQRVTYYHKVCDSLGLNPYTRPFDYISLNGKLTLYAKKDATEQLRQVKNISIVELEGRMIDDLYVVTAKACTPSGRTDQATGAVSIGSLRGEQKANAIMKAETKAKRRVTLSIAGMGFTDESEIDSIPNAKFVNVDPQTGMIEDKVKPLYIESNETISIKQAIELNELLQGCSEASRANFNKVVKDSFKIDCLEDLPLSKYENIKSKLKASKKQYDEELLAKEMAMTGEVEVME